MDRLLEQINDPADLRRLDSDELAQLTRELREFIIASVSRTGGHLSSNLGTVELAIALHYVFDTPRDRLVWDVGHQTYPHKILTGRREGMAKLRQWGGIAGFPRRVESEYDSFGTAHSSTSISAALGMAIAARRKGEARFAVEPPGVLHAHRAQRGSGRALRTFDQRARLGIEPRLIGVRHPHAPSATRRRVRSHSTAIAAAVTNGSAR